MKAYLDIVKKILQQGTLKQNRAGVDTIVIAGAIFEHDMSKGFPLLTTKSVPLRLVASELEFFIKGERFGFGVPEIAPGQVKSLKKVVPAGVDGAGIFRVFLIKLLEGIRVEVLQKR